jgi:aspartate/methionine/tyrosine aminotransferase
LEAFDTEYLKGVQSIFKERRDALYSALSPIFNIDAKPEGAFYLWADISKYSDDGFDFAKKMLEDIHVAVTPGVDFGSQKHYIRFAYTREISHMLKGIKRIKEWLKGYK